MKPKALLNSVLFVVLAALIGVALLEPRQQETNTVHLTDVDTDAITRFELKGQQTLAFEKRDGHWWLIQPFQAPANDIRIRQLLNIAKAESRANYPVKPEELAKFKLDKPMAELNLGQVSLRFGGSEPIDMLRYVQIGDTLHLVADDFSHHLQAGAVDFVDKKLLPEGMALKEIAVPGLNAKLGDKGHWQAEPVGDAQALAELANGWQSARAIEVKRHEGPMQGDKLRFTAVNGKIVEFTLLQREPDLVLTRPDWQLDYVVAGESGKRLLGLQKNPAEPDGDAPEEESESPPGDHDNDTELDRDTAPDVDGD